MTSEEFFRQLALTPRDWRLEGGKIRRGAADDAECPITAVARHLVGASAPAAGGVNRAARALALDGRLASRIVAATDELEAADASLRADLLEACGLTAGTREEDAGVAALIEVAGVLGAL
jgi:hypothetical protein